MLLVAASPELDRCRFEANGATAGGGLAIAGHGGAAIVECEFLDNTAEHGGGAVVWVGQARFSGCTFANDAADSSGGAVHAALAGVSVEACTFVGNGAGVAGSSLSADLESSLDVSRSILAFGGGGEPVAIDSTSTLDVACTDVFGNPGGDWVGPLAPWDGVDGNFSADPLFCDVSGGDFRLAAASPCLPGQHPTGADCDTVGAHGPGSCSGVGAPALEAPASSLRLSARPNPFSASVEIRWSGPRDAVGRITVHDVSGRVVRRLPGGDPIGGGGRVVWDGRDDRGRPVTSGVYWARVHVGDRTAVRRVVLRR
jgi:hypothetical protein